MISEMSEALSKTPVIHIVYIFIKIWVLKNVQIIWDYSNKLSIYRYVQSISYICDLKAYAESVPSSAIYWEL